MSEGENGDVLLVIPCLNEERHLPSLLEDLLRDVDGALIVVADGGSSDGSRAIVERFARDHRNLVLLDNPRRIQSAAVNLAARRYGQGRRWLVRVDAHARYPDRYVARLKEAARARNATSVVVPMVSQGITCFQRAAAAAQNSVLGTGGSAHRHLGEGREVDHGHHALFDIGLFLAVGGYDETFVANEDAELDRRLIAAGGRLWLEPAAAIAYFPRRSAGALFRQYRHYGMGRARNLRRHPVPMRVRQALPLAVAPAVMLALLGAILAIVQPWAAVLAIPSAGWLTATMLAGVALSWRERCGCAAASGIAAAAMHLGWSVGFLEVWARRQALPPAPSPLLLQHE